MMLTVRLRAPNGAHVLLAGGILGLAEDGPTVRARLEAGTYDAIGLGIPFEDLDAIRATDGQESKREFERDATDELYVRELARYGPVQVPPSDLYEAFRHAAQRKLPIEAIDLGDEGHTAAWTKHVGMIELLRNNRRLRRLDEPPFRATRADDFAREWDARIFPTKGLRRVQADREAWMAGRIRLLLDARRNVFALVPLARWAGVRDRLVAEAGHAVEP